MLNFIYLANWKPKKSGTYIYSIISIQALRVAPEKWKIVAARIIQQASSLKIVALIYAGS